MQGVPATHRSPGRWRELSPAARRYLLHLALLTLSLSIVVLYYNLAVLALGYQRHFLGMLNTVTQAAAALLSLPLWFSVQRIGLRTALLASAVLHAASVLLFAVWPDAAPLLASAALMGVAAVIAQVAAAPFMMRISSETTRDFLFSASAAVAIGLNGIGNLGAGFLSDALGDVLAAAPDSGLVYRAAFAIAGCGALLSIAPLLLIRQPARENAAGRDDVRETEPGRADPPDAASLHLVTVWSYRHRLVPEPLQLVLRNRAFLITLLIPPFLISWGAALLIPYLNLYFRERFGVDNRTLGALFAAFDVATGVAALAGPALAARWGKMRTVVLTRALGVPMLLLLGMAGELWLAVAAALIRVVLFNMAAPLYDAYAMERTSEQARPFVIGLLGGAYSAGFLIAPLMSTAVQERYGFGPLFAATTMLYAVAVLLTWWFFVRGAASRAP
ncbi:MAG: MFS transporter [Chloroflexi bacterium]|nr:MFS transporter [Chloroflexota bacterium]